MLFHFIGNSAEARRVVEYRTFRNADPPQILALWEQAGLGRGAVGGVTVDAFERLVYSQPYFDPAGLIVAEDQGRLVGFTQAGFGANADRSGIDRRTGVICAVVVHPERRRQGIGRELVRRAEAYLRDRGAQELLAGPAPPHDPFFFGLYGGSEAAGFLESDPAAAPFFAAVGYQPAQRWAVFQRELSRGGDPMSVRLLGIRRKMRLGIAADPPDPTWWWTTHQGRLDTARFLLLPKTSETPVAGLTILGLDLYLPRWRQRAIGLTDLHVAEPDRRQGYAQALLIETCRRMRDELVTLAEGHAREDDPAVLRLLESSGFERVDTGVVYRRA